MLMQLTKDKTAADPYKLDMMSMMICMFLFDTSNGSFLQGDAHAHKHKTRRTSGSGVLWCCYSFYPLELDGIDKTRSWRYSKHIFLQYSKYIPLRRGDPWINKRMGTVQFALTSLIACCLGELVWWCLVLRQSLCICRWGVSKCWTNKGNRGSTFSIIGAHWSNDAVLFRLVSMEW